MTGSPNNAAIVAAGLEFVTAGDAVEPDVSALVQGDVINIAAIAAGKISFILIFMFWFDSILMDAFTTLLLLYC
jgi:hypothetical protein